MKHNNLSSFWQVTLDTLFGKGACDKGTLTQIKNVFGHRNVKKKASDCMNHLTNFMDFVTEGHILLLAAQLRPSGELKQLLTSTDEVSTLAREIVQFIRPQINEYVASVDDNRNYTCICNEEDGKSYILNKNQLIPFVCPKSLYKTITKQFKIAIYCCKSKRYSANFFFICIENNLFLISSCMNQM
jgi:hypothetical protein